MASDVGKALLRFTETLGDPSVDKEAKLKVLRTLDEVTLTLSELSNSGVGRAVRRLKSEPGELGQRARSLVIKWKALLDEHIKRGNIQIPELMRKKQELPVSANEPEFQLPFLRQLKSCKRPSSPEPVSQSLDASSGLSFEQAMSMTAPIKKKGKKRPKVAHEREFTDLRYPSQAFTQEILSSLSIPFDLPYIQEQVPVPKRLDTTSINDLADDGDLKFRSKKVIWAPRVRRSVDNGTAQNSASLSITSGLTEPPTLVEACLLVLAKNISLVDSVGEVPYELFSRALHDASPEDLLRIEKHNPKFRGLMDDLWKKHVYRCFPESRNLDGIRPKETWAKMYVRLEAENSRRLKQFIKCSSIKQQAERETRRTTLITDAITPAQIQRRATRLIDGHGMSRSYHRYGGGSSSSRSGEVKMVFKPRNMSYPTPPQSIYPATASTSSGSRIDSSSANRQTSSMLQKLRKQFLKGR
ncbi:transcription elongation factor b polypeptide 3 [Echinococcus multilocularis]|uniref:Elongin-A n=1 Tax=Echinococcus multilocularis TaxID=6211 RepID=A0A068YIU8_ECHMU|nr:transcription elongation factor b polypeptide 3 [Echinococcus multilocularis]